MPNLRTEALTSSLVCLSDDTIAVRDSRDERLVHILDAASGQILGKPLSHPLPILDIKLDQV